MRVQTAQWQEVQVIMDMFLSAHTDSSLSSPVQTLVTLQLPLDSFKINYCDSLFLCLLQTLASSTRKSLKGNSYIV